LPADLGRQQRFDVSGDSVGALAIDLAQADRLSTLVGGDEQDAPAASWQFGRVNSSRTRHLVSMENAFSR
jgi:hypothetical protein